jgi:hypothetical protein
MATCPNGHDSASDDFCDVCGMRIAGSPSPGSPSARSTGGAGSTAGGGYGSASGSPAGEPCPRCGTPRVGQFCEACGYRFGAAQPPWAPAPPAPRPSGLTSGSQPLAAPRRPPSAQPPPSSQPRLSPQPPPWTPARTGPSVAGAPPGSSVTGPPSVPPVPSIPTAPPVSPTRPVAPPPYAPVTWSAVVSCDRAYHQSVQAASGPDAAAVPFPGYYAERRFRLTGPQMRIGRRSVSRGIDPEIDLTGPPADPGISRLHAVLIAGPDGSWAVLDPGSANGTLVNGAEIPTGVQVPLRDGDRINLGGWTAITVHRG